MAQTKECKDEEIKQEHEKRQRLCDEVATYVLDKLGGKPKDFYRVDVHNVFGGHFRVNVVMSDGEGLATRYYIGHSYFVYYGLDGFMSDPPVAKA